MNPLKPIVVAQGDDSTRRGANMVMQIVFPDVPFEVIDVGVQARLDTDDACIAHAVERMLSSGTGIKISTASNDPRIRERKMKSANIKMRPMAGAIGMYRASLAPGGYKKPVAVMRNGTGDFYDEFECPTEVIEGVEYAFPRTRLNLSSLAPLARAAVERARKGNMKLQLAAKWTIAESERLFVERIKKVWTEEYGLVEDVDFTMKLTDMAIAAMPVSSSAGTNEGGWLLVVGNANGDTASDVADFQQGGKAFSSEVICEKMIYHELPGGTAPGRKDSDFRGPNFFSPMDTLGAFCAAIKQLNPELTDRCDRVFAAAIEYMSDTPEEKRDTEEMLKKIAAV